MEFSSKFSILFTGILCIIPAVFGGSDLPGVVPYKDTCAAVAGNHDPPAGAKCAQLDQSCSNIPCCRLGDVANPTPGQELYCSTGFFAEYGTGLSVGRTCWESRCAKFGCMGNNVICQPGFGAKGGDAFGYGHRTTGDCCSGQNLRCEVAGQEMGDFFIKYDIYACEIAPTPPPTTTTTTPAPDPTPKYYFQDVNSKKCLNVYGSSTGNGAGIILSTCANGASSQLWKMKFPEQQAVAQLVNTNSGKCLVVPTGVSDDNTSLVQQPCSNSNYALWLFMTHGESESYQIKNMATQKCLATYMAGTSDNTILVISSCAAKNNQYWLLSTWASIQSG